MVLEMKETRFVLINPQDNILVCCQNISVGEKVNIDDQFFEMKVDICVGHKIARTQLSKGNKVIRYGVSIGSTVADIDIGEHVHMHNMKSDYIPSHTRQSLVGA